jgi:small ligand-binding sensory domain FIST
MPSPSAPPRFAAAMSSTADSADAAREAARQALGDLTAKPHLALVFASPHHQDSFQAIGRTLAAELDGACVLGCTGESILCGGREIEGQPALAIWIAHLAGVELLPMHLEFQPTSDGGSLSGWHQQLESEWPPDVSLLVLAEPFSFPADVLLARLNEDRPGTIVTGGMASGGWQPGQNRLLLQDRALDRGALALAIRGPIEIRTVVSQGCRPIGRPFVVTKAERNVIFELGGAPALAKLRELFAELAPDDQRLAQQGLHVGQVINEYQDAFGRGDFLVRNVQGVDPDSGAIAIGDFVRVGQTVQFHVRDAETADEDLNALLTSAQSATAADCLGALVFTCNGRGTRLFDEPHHDAGCVARHFDVPIAGFFAQGEIGPVGGKNFLHGFTASIALFGAPDSAR